MEDAHFVAIMTGARGGEPGAERRDESGDGMQEGEHREEYGECGGGPSGYPGSGDTPIFWVRMVILIFCGSCTPCRGILGGGFGVSGSVRRRAGLAARAGGDGVARSLVLFQLAEAAVDGALDAAFVAGELDEGVGTFAIHVEGAGQEVALVGRRGRRRHRFAVLFGVLFLRSVLLLAEFFLCGDIVEAVAVDAGFEGEGAVQAPLVVGDAQDQFFFGGADGAEAIQVIVDEEEELFGVLVEQDVFVGAQAVEEAIAAGCGFAFGCFWASLFLCVPAVGVDLGLAGGAGFIRAFHIHISGRVSPYLAFMLWGANRGFGWQFRQVVENRGEGILVGLSPKTG